MLEIPIFSMASDFQGLKSLRVWGVGFPKGPCAEMVDILNVYTIWAHGPSGLKVQKRLEASRLWGSRLRSVWGLQLKRFKGS